MSKTDGVPLFVEELTKMVVESDLVKEVNGHYELSGPLPPLAIPSTLQDSLMARLDRLATVREIAQIGATIGREFNYDLLQAVSPLNEETLQQGLWQLVEAELVFQSGVPPQAQYLFKHALVQDTAYQSLLKSRRQSCINKWRKCWWSNFLRRSRPNPNWWRITIPKPDSFLRPFRIGSRLGNGRVNARPTPKQSAISPRDCNCFRPYPIHLSARSKN